MTIDQANYTITPLLDYTELARVLNISPCIAKNIVKEVMIDLGLVDELAKTLLCSRNKAMKIIRAKIDKINNLWYNA